MNTIDILFIACLLLLYFLPKKSETYKYYRVIPLVIFFVAIGIRIQSKIESHNNSWKITELNLQIKAQKIDLNKKNNQIVELEKKAKKAERGISSTYDFNGAKRIMKGHGNTEYQISDEFIAFQKIIKLETQKNYPELIAICKQQIENAPEWLTPYYFLGLAYANTGNKEKAIDLFKHVLENAPDDPSYAQTNEFLNKLRE